MAKQYFADNNIEYEEHDVSTDDAAREEMVKKSGQLGVPVIEINGEVQVGFNKPEIERALQEADQSDQAQVA